MDADRLPVLNNPHDEVQPMSHDSVLPTEKQDYDDIKEKGSDNGVAGYQQTTLDIQSVDAHYIPGDPLPMDPNLPEEHAQFTIRAVFVGLCLGAVVQVSSSDPLAFLSKIVLIAVCDIQASNLYLGLKTGFTFGPQLLGGIGGFLILKPLSRVLPKSLPTWL